MKKKAALILICILMILFIMMPFPASGLTVRLYFDNFEGEDLVVYYTTDENPNMGSDQILTAAYDAQDKLAAIRISPGLADHITHLRLDFPDAAQILSVKNVSVSSAGIIRHSYSPCSFFSESSILSLNDIPQINLIWSKGIAYIQTDATDPYIEFDDALLRDMLQYRSSYRLTRAALCILAVLGYISFRTRLFDAPGKTH